jgi:hypothetical protein
VRLEPLGGHVLPKSGQRLNKAFDDLWPGDKGTHALSSVQPSFLLQLLQSLAHDRPAHPELFAQLSFAGESIARLEFSVVN